MNQNNLIRSLSDFAKSELKTYRFEFNQQKALKFLKEDIFEEFIDLNKDETKSARKRTLNIEKANLSDYSERFITLKDGKEVIAGIRHLGGNSSIPFINIKTNFEINLSSEIIEIYSQIKSYFKLFSPLYICLNSNRPLDCSFIASITMANTQIAIKNTPWRDENKISFESIEDESYYDWYVENYEAFHKEKPELKDFVTTNSKAVMKDSLNQGLLKYIKYDQMKVGLISADDSELLGHKGYYFNEILISKKFRGQGLAKAAQRKFIKDYFDDDSIVWGTIDSRNLASYSTALSNNRKPIRFECFFDISGV